MLGEGVAHRDAIEQCDHSTRPVLGGTIPDRNLTLLNVDLVERERHEPNVELRAVMQRVVASQIWCKRRLTQAPHWGCYAAAVTVSADAFSSASIGVGSMSSRRSSARRRMEGMVCCTPRQPRLARSSTAHTSDRHERSPGSRPMTFTRRRVSPKVRSMKLECRMRPQC